MQVARKAEGRQDVLSQPIAKVRAANSATAQVLMTATAAASAVQFSLLCTSEVLLPQLDMITSRLPQAEGGGGC